MSAGWPMAAAEIAALKETFGVRTEPESAAMLGLSRSTTSTWKKRGGVPARYLAMLEADAGNSDATAAGQQVFRRPEAHYWLRTALALQPDSGADPAGLLQTGRSKEQLVIALMALAIRVARADLKRQTVRDDAEWARLMELLVFGRRDAVVASSATTGPAHPKMSSMESSIAKIEDSEPPDHRGDRPAKAYEPLRTRVESATGPSISLFQGSTGHRATFLMCRQRQILWAVPLIPTSPE
jgi:hypothetical protein